jgi:hypothetical protein
MKLPIKTIVKTTALVTISYISLSVSYQLGKMDALYEVNTENNTSIGFNQEECSQAEIDAITDPESIDLLNYCISYGYQRQLPH